MGKHSFDYRRHGPRPVRTSWRLVFAVPICMTFVFVGVDMYQHPARCDHQPMGQWDRCEHYGRASERLARYPNPGACRRL